METGQHGERTARRVFASYRGGALTERPASSGSDAWSAVDRHRASRTARVDARVGAWTGGRGRVVRAEPL